MVVSGAYSMSLKCNALSLQSSIFAKVSLLKRYLVLRKELRVKG